MCELTEGEVEEAIEEALNEVERNWESAKYKKVADEFWHGDFNFEKLFLVMGDIGIDEIKKILHKMEGSKKGHV